jgi:hypothetical protein
MEPSLTNGLILALLIVGLYWLVMRSRRKRRGPGSYKISHAHHSERATGASLDFAAAFGDMLPDDSDGVSLLRVSITNRGEAALEADDFERPILITLPGESRVLDAAAASGHGRVDRGSVSVDRSLNTVEIAPFRLGDRSSMIFNIVVQGAAEPFEIDGSFALQPRLEPSA